MRRRALRQSSLTLDNLYGGLVKRTLELDRGQRWRRPVDICRVETAHLQIGPDPPIARLHRREGPFLISCPRTGFRQHADNIQLDRSLLLHRFDGQLPGGPLTPLVLKSLLFPLKTPFA